MCTRRFGDVVFAFPGGTRRALRHFLGIARSVGVLVGLSVESVRAGAFAQAGVVPRRQVSRCAAHPLGCVCGMSRRGN